MQNNKKKKIKILFPAFLSVLLLITLFPFSVFANGILPVYTSTPSSDDLFSSPIYNINYHFAVNNSDVDYFYFHNTTNNSNNIVFICTSAFSVYYYPYNNTVKTESAYGGSGYYQYSVTANGASDVIPFLGDFANTNSACSYALSNGVTYPSNEPIIKYPYTFQNGYLFVYDLGQSSAMYSFDLTSKSEEYSDGGSVPFPDTNQAYWFSDSLPEVDETQIPASGSTIISWSKGDKTNIFGQTQDMIATINGTSSGRYLYIYNPPAHTKWSGNSNPVPNSVVNYPVTINGVSSGDNFYIYDSYARLSDYNRGGFVQGTVTGTTGYGSVSTDGAIIVTTSDGAIYNQSSGGSTDITGANGGSLAENINGLKETLDNFLSQFVQLLSAPISHIRQLISASHEFLFEFSHFFDWLPSEVSGFVISAFIVMIAIGIFKLFL